MKAKFLAILLIATASQAMPFSQFDGMAAQDRQDYMKFLVECVQRVLIDQGHKDQAAKVYQLFNEILPGDALPLGEAEFEGNLSNARVRDAKRHAEDPNARRIEIESALTGTLRKNGFDVTQDFVNRLMKLANTFKPKYSPQPK